MCHGKNQQRHRQHRSNPEPSGHVFGLGALFFAVRGQRPGFERHAANWTEAWFILLHLWVHGTRVDCFGFHSADWVNGHDMPSPASINCSVRGSTAMEGTPEVPILLQFDPRRYGSAPMLAEFWVADHTM